MHKFTKTCHIRTVIFLVCFVFSYNFVLSYVSAQSLGFSLSKSIVDIELLPGTSFNGNIQVVNNSKDAALPISMLLDHFDQKDEAGDIDFVNVTPELNALSWFQFKQGKELVLNPGETKNLVFTIEPPKTALPGSYYVIMRFSPLFGEGFFIGESARQVPQIGVLFFIKIADLGLDVPREKYGARLMGLALQDRNNKVKTLGEALLPIANAGILETALQKIELRILNTGRYYFIASGQVIIKNWLGGTVYKIELPKKYLLPDRVRKLELDAPAIQAEFSGFFDRFRHTLYATLYNNTFFGPYTAEINLDIPEQKPLTAAISFWVVPWKFWMPFLIIMVAVIWLLVKLRHRLRLAFFTLIGR